ncbi:MAG: flagellar basal body P-ring formation protein FlgA [Gammaproteobacteria bacterium]|nr:flagellar basal body P-ring formation protein FlgA [Gammaproteobacteria bacterium]
MKSFVKFAAAVGLIASMSALAGGDMPIVIGLRSQATVTGAQIRLADIADIQADAAVRQRLAVVQIASAPPIGGRRVLEREQVARAMRQSGGELSFSIEGSDTIAIERPAAEYDGAQLLAAAQAHLAEHLRGQVPTNARVQITPVTNVPSFRGPAGQWRAAPRPLRGIGVAKRMCVWLDIEVNGAIYRSLPVWFAVSVYRPALVTRRAYGSKEPITTNDIAIEERDVAALASPPIAADTALTGLRTRRFVAAGNVLQASDIESLPSILADQEVDVHVITGPIAIDTKAVAQEEGSIGKIIRVRNPASTLTYTAKVVGDRKVLVTE